MMELNDVLSFLFTTKISSFIQIYSNDSHIHSFSRSVAARSLNYFNIFQKTFDILLETKFSTKSCFLNKRNFKFKYKILNVGVFIFKILLYFAKYLFVYLFSCYCYFRNQNLFIINICIVFQTNLLIDGY